uniref:Uncharacterized protein n=1 Tax=Picea glauca TaxID=3330 RepID=A0A101LWY7_PICGL|nr:hypothetical protein ABT39_MTgene6302 [Picea glauca]QHR88006.1 hypothetical protein Q903MT_gene2018 [Picea sitchensis]
MSFIHEGRDNLVFSRARLFLTQIVRQANLSIKLFLTQSGRVREEAVLPRYWSKDINLEMRKNKD